MTIDKISRLLNALDTSTNKTTKAEQPGSNLAARVSNGVSTASRDEAVRISENFGSGLAQLGDEQNSEERTKRVSELKAQVERGTFSRDANAVARKIFSDLFG